MRKAYIIANFVWLALAATVCSESLRLKVGSFHAPGPAFLPFLAAALVGVLPGLGPTAAMSLLLPATFHATPVSAVIMLAGIYYGAMYGGSTTSILVNIPGEAASVVTTFDGYHLKQSLMLSKGSFQIFFTRPISSACLIIALVLLVLPLLPRFRKQRPGAALPSEDEV